MTDLGGLMNQLDEMAAMTRRRDLEEEARGLARRTIGARVPNGRSPKVSVRFWTRLSEWAAERAENARWN